MTWAEFDRAIELEAKLDCGETLTAEEVAEVVAMLLRDFIERARERAET